MVLESLVEWYVLATGVLCGLFAALVAAQSLAARLRTRRGPAVAGVSPAPVPAQAAAAAVPAQPRPAVPAQPGAAVPARPGAAPTGAAVPAQAGADAAA